MDDRTAGNGFGTPTRRRTWMVLVCARLRARRRAMAGSCPGAEQRWPEDAQAWALLFAGYLGGDMDDRRRARLEESLVLFRTLGDARGAERALFFLGLR